MAGLPEPYSDAVPCPRFSIRFRPRSHLHMQAIIKAQRAPGLKVATVPKPSPGRSDVLIAVRHAGVCGTDLHIADWTAWAEGRIRPPLVVGHEFAGEIVGVGDGVTELKVGQLVTAEGHIVCGHCLQCRTGNGHICQNTRSIVFVVGCGPIGCFAVGIARAAGAAKVIASDVNATRLALAGRMGAHVTIDATRDDVVRTVRAETAGEGADVVCEMSGVPAAVHQAFAAVRMGGRVQLLGIPDGQVPVDFAAEIIFKGITVYGVIGRKMYETWHQMRRYLTTGLFDPRPVITHQFPLANIDDALGAIRSGDAGKIILEIA